MHNIVVTVAVITYNSSKFIRETLDSIKAQTYDEIKLIVTDDCSTDNTLKIVKDWIEKNKARFISTQVITSDKNTGVTANYNRAFDACDTQWLKELGGDDILTPNCIEENVSYVLEHPDAVAVFSRVWPFRTRFRKKVTAKRNFCYDFFNYSEQEKYHHLFYITNALPVQTAFFNVVQLRKLDIRHDERIPMFEDYPMWITFLRKGVRFDFMDKTTVWYRQHKEALSSNIYTPNYFKSNILFLLYYFLDEIKEGRDRNHIYDLISNRATKIYGWAYYPATMFKNSLDYKIGHLLLSPFRFLKLIFSKLLYYTKVLLWRAFNR